VAVLLRVEAGPHVGLDRRTMKRRAEKMLGDRYLDRDTRGNVVTTRAAETANTWWHRMTTSAGAAPGSPIGARTYGNAAANASTTTDVTWNWQADFAYWVTRGYGAGFFAPSAVVGKNPGVPANVPDVPEDGQYGRLWSHADTRVGMAGSWSIDVAGYHAQKNSVNPAQELANGYATLQPYVRTSEIGQPKLWAIDWTFPVYSCAPIDCPSFTAMEQVRERTAETRVRLDELVGEERHDPGVKRRQHGLALALMKRETPRFSPACWRPEAKRATGPAEVAATMPVVKRPVRSGRSRPPAAKSLCRCLPISSKILT
jgi:hypothetical protein